MKQKADIGLIGLAVMGENLVLNMENKGYTVAVFNRSVEKVEKFIHGRGAGKNFIGATSMEELVAAIERPRKVMMLIKAGKPVDEMIEQLVPLLDEGDIIIDGGNSHFPDTIRRTKYVESKGLLYIGTGVSGGEEGALNGPSMMPGGSEKAWKYVKDIFQAIAAKVDDGTPCCDWVGKDGAGHFVKMVHNGIEYGDMQLIAEIYDVMRRGLGLKANQISDVFEEWNKGILDSFLIEITAKILSVTDPDTGKFLVDLIVDKAGQKGTGKWTGEIALDLGIAIPTIDAALTGRLLSALKDERVVASKKLSGPANASIDPAESKKVLAALHDALYASKVCSYAQGMALIRAGSNEYKWNVDLSECARIWEGGCIIRAKLLQTIKQAFKRQGDVNNLLVDPEFSAWIVEHQGNWRYAVTTAVNAGIPVPALSASLAYFDSYRCANLPQNLTQAQRDFFGAHTYERVDRPDAGFIHTDWPSLIKEKTGKPS